MVRLICLFAVLFSLLLSTVSSASWVKIYEDSRIHYYADTDKINRGSDSNGGYYRAIIGTNFKDEDSHILSIQDDYFYDNGRYTIHNKGRFNIQTGEKVAETIGERFAPLNGITKGSDLMTQLESNVVSIYKDKERDAKQKPKETKNNYKQPAQSMTETAKNGFVAGLGMAVFGLIGGIIWYFIKKAYNSIK